MHFSKFIALFSFLFLASCSNSTDETAPPSKNIVVTTVEVKQSEIEDVFTSQGAIVAWEEAIISTRVGGLPIAEIYAEVGDIVAQGQVLAKLDDTTVQLDVSMASASLAEASAAAVEARANYDKQLSLNAQKFVSEQDLLIAKARADAAMARRDAAQSAFNIQKQRLADTEIKALDSGTIRTRSAVLGSMSMVGQPLFTLFRDSKIEWAAELLPEQVSLLDIGSQATINLPDGSTSQGIVRFISPGLDNANRLGLAMVRLKDSAFVLPGNYVSGQFALAKRQSVLLTMKSLVQRDGRTFVFVVNQDKTVSKTFVEIGRQFGDQFEILSGLTTGQIVVADGAGFLSDGEKVDINNNSVGA